MNEFHRYITTHDRKPRTQYVKGVRMDGSHPLIPACTRVELYRPGVYAPETVLPPCEYRSPVKAAESFAWGEHSPEADQLAYTLLLLAKVPAKQAKECYKTFCDEVVASLKWLWVICLKEVKEWAKVYALEQAHHKKLEAARPKTVAPRSLPFYGVMEATLIPYAYDKVKEFLTIAPSHPDANAAMAHLELAAKLTQVRRETVGSIYWANARAEARTNIWLQLLMMESQILYNIEQFGKWWDVYVDTLNEATIVFPLPAHMTPELAALTNFREHKWHDLSMGIYDLRQFANNAQKRLDQYEPFLAKHQVQTLEAVTAPLTKEDANGI